jgi:hypothetical protein
MQDKRLTSRLTCVQVGSPFVVVLGCLLSLQSSKARAPWTRTMCTLAFTARTEVTTCTRQGEQRGKGREENVPIVSGECEIKRDRNCQILGSRISHEQP